MWSKSDAEAEGAGREPGTEVVAMSEMMPPEGLTRPAQPPVNIIKSSKIQVGHKFYKITQNVDNTEMVKGRVLGLELVSPAKANRLRCSVAVFVCWTFLVAFGLGFYLFQIIIRPTLEDIAYSLPQYVWNIAKNSTRAERLSCAASVVALLLCTALIVYFTVVVKKNDVNSVDRAPHPWNITREMWRARPPPYGHNDTHELFNPLKLVVIHHSVSPECHRFTICAAEMRNLQNYFLDSPDRGWDLPYNFAIGNDGRVYRVRDWNRVGAHTPPFNRCAVGIGFIGDYREDLNIHTQVTDLQLQRLNMILQEGVDRGYLRPDYSIVGARDIANTASPGDNLYKAIQGLDHYDTTNYRGLTCEIIHEMLDNNDTP